MEVYRPAENSWGPGQVINVGPLHITDISIGNFSPTFYPVFHLATVILAVRVLSVLGTFKSSVFY